MSVSSSNEFNDSSFNEHLVLYQALWHVALIDILVILVFVSHNPLGWLEFTEKLPNHHRAGG